jgi:hypothetical protein
MRNPVGPLPSSIYWRRRAVALCLLALVAVVVIYAVNSGGGGGGSGNNGSPSHSPASTITPGPEPSGTHITGRPGGRDTSGGTGRSGGSSGSGDGGSSSGGSTGASASGGSGSSGANGGATDGSSAGTTQGGDSAGGAGTSGGTGTSGGSGGPLPVGSTLPDCDPGSVQLSLRTAQNSYGPGETPAFELRATNSGSVTCKVDFGPKKAVFTVTGAADSAHTWATDDCPAPGSGSYLLQVPAHGSTTYTAHWNGKTSSPKCATPKGAVASPGTYLVAAQLPGYPAKQVSFVLSQD